MTPKTIINLLLILALSVFFQSCNRKAEKTTDITQDDKYDSTVNLNTKTTLNKADINEIKRKKYCDSCLTVKIKDPNTKFSSASPKDRNLPFGPQNISINSLGENAEFYSKLIGRHFDEYYDKDSSTYKLVYKLPEIEKIEVVNIRGWNYKQCINGDSIDNFWIPTKYKYRLPNIGKLNVFYMCDFGNFAAVGACCPDYYYNHYNSEYGYLIIYNPENRQAKIIEIYYLRGGDGSIKSRYFYIDKNYKIYTADYAVADDQDSHNAGKKNIITISLNGAIDIKSTPTFP